MAIEKYCITKGYGFGFVKRNNGTYFTDRIEITDGRNVREFYTGTYKLRLPKRRFLPPLYLVLENGIWKEFFTGIQVKSVDSADLPEYTIKLDLKLPESISIAKKAGIRELASFSFDINELDAEEFAHRIASYSEDEIKMIVEFVYDMQEKATQFGPRLEKTIEDAVNEWNDKKAAELVNLERKMGAYTKTEDNQREEDEQKEKEEQIGTSDYVKKAIAWIFRNF